MQSCQHDLVQMKQSSEKMWYRQLLIRWRNIDLDHRLLGYLFLLEAIIYNLKMHVLRLEYLVTYTVVIPVPPP